MEVLLKESKQGSIDFNAKSSNGYSGYCIAIKKRSSTMIQMIREASLHRKIDLGLPTKTRLKQFFR